MLKLNASSLTDKAGWQAAGVKLPQFDWHKMQATTMESPMWVHFGAGNLFRGFIARLGQDMLNAGVTERGIIAADTFDYEIIEKIYVPHDNLTLMVGLLPDGSTDRYIIGSIAEGVKANSADAQQIARLTEIFENKSLQMVSFTITEKGYAINNMQGELMPVVKADMEEGPTKARHAMSLVAAMMLARYKVGAAPIALVSMDNCSHNGEKLRNSVLAIVDAWIQNGFADAGFAAYMSDEARVGFPWSMIDKITPRPSEIVEKSLTEVGIDDMAPIITGRNTFIAPFVNAEVPEYLVVEDNFPNGRPPLEKAGVYMTTRDTVNNTERMKVTTCLNPLHTALAVYGCLLGYNSIASEMNDKELKSLVEKIGYQEGMPVVVDPKIVNPMAFIQEVVEKRLPNPFIPDMPQRIATDTSQKVGIRFGETIKSYMASDTLDVKSLTFIPLALAGWLRYLLAVDDKCEVMELSGDPMKDELQAKLAGIKVGNPETYKGELKTILTNEVVFGVDLVACGLADKIETMFVEMLAGKDAVRATLQKYLG